MHPVFASSISRSRGEFGTLLAREIGAARLDQGDFLFNRVEAVVRNLLAERSPPHGNGNDFYHHVTGSDFDPASPLDASVTVGQKFAVKTLLGIESRAAQEVKQNALWWIRRQFDKVLDGSERSYMRCFEKIWGFLRQLYHCGQGKVIAHFYVDTFRGDWIKQAKLEVFIAETVEADFLAAKPEALELMAFAANSFSKPFVHREDELLMNSRMFQRSIRFYDEELCDRLVSRLASLGVPFAEDVLVDKALTLAESEGEWDRFGRVCQKLAEWGNSSAQKYLGEMLEHKLSFGSLSAGDLSSLKQTVKWFFEDCPVTSCDFLAKALESGKIGELTIDLSVEERLALLKRRFNVGDESAGGALSRIYVSNQIGDLPLNLSPMEQVEAIAELAESSSPCFIHKILTNIYNTNRIGGSPLPFSLEERYKRIETLAQKGSGEASHIMLTAYLENQLFLPIEEFFLDSFSPFGAERELESLPLGLTHEERVGKLYALALAGDTSAVDAALSYLNEHEREFGPRVQRALLFRLLVSHPTSITFPLTTLPLGFSHDQVRVLRLLSSFHAALLE